MIWQRHRRGRRGQRLRDGPDGLHRFPDNRRGRPDDLRWPFDAFVTKLDATGSGLVYSTYLGGTGSDPGLSIAVDGTGSAYVTGITPSTDFPTTPGAVQTTLARRVRDAFVAKIEFVATLPTSKDQCKNGGWKTFGVFKNQGDCVSFVASRGKNPPSGS